MSSRLPNSDTSPRLARTLRWTLLVIAGTLKTPGLAEDRPEAPPAIDFETDVQPILTRFGCNSGPCHGKSRGQGGFQLSLLAFDPQQDFDAIVKEARGRRVLASNPEESLLIAKPTGMVPHGGGRRMTPGSREYATLLAWIRSGLPRRVEGAPQLTGIRVEPSGIELAPGQQQSLLVTATYSDGSTRDVTHLATYLSSEAPLADVSETGVITAGRLTGDAAIMARYMGRIAVCEVLIPRPGVVAPDVYSQLPRRNFVDDLVWAKLQRLNITPSGICDDHTFLRRATTDLCGRIPTPEEVVQFLADRSPDKRDRLIDRLLEEPAFAEHLASKWADLLRPNPYRVGIKAVFNHDHWIRQSFHDRKPWDQFVRELLTARGSTFRNGAVTLFRDRREPDELTTIVSQLFLGVRLDCARCHHHPFEVWGQDDFYSFAAYFAKIGRKGTGLSPPISGSEEFFFVKNRGRVEHPVTGREMKPQPLFGEAPAIPEEGDPREALADWITSPDNFLFAQVMANRVWADLMTRGLVEPVDDLRATNPASNAPLLKALGDFFRESRFSITELYRVIAKSHVYQLSSLPGETNVADTRNHSRHYRRRLRAETLLDATAAITGVPVEFPAMPPDSSARQLWTHRGDSVFLDTFGRPDPNQDPPCERNTDPTVVQALHLMNSDQLRAAIRHDQGTAARLANSPADASGIASELYRRVFGREPASDEVSLVNELLTQPDANRRQVVEDLMWAMMNSAEFVIQD